MAKKVGVTSVNKKYLSVDEVCRIIEVCNVNGVKVLKFQDLHVSLGQQVNEQQVQTTQTQSDLTEIQHLELNKRSVARDEISIREEQLAMALVEDPVKYEELLRDGDLSDADDEEDDDI